MVRTIGERTHNAREQTDLDPGELFGVTLYFTAVRLYSYESSQPDRFAPVPTVFEAKSDVEAKAKLDEALKTHGHDCRDAHCGDWTRPSRVIHP
jgi:hypothetical protein